MGCRRPHLGVVALLLLVAIVAAATVSASPASARTQGGVDPSIAALQITMRARLLYRGPVTGVQDLRTAAALMLLQQRLGVGVDGVFGPETRGRLFPLGSPVLGRRLLTVGTKGYDVALLRIQLALHGFPSGKFTSVYTDR